MTVRELSLGSCTLQIAEHKHLQDEAGAVIWDAGLVLVHYLAHQTGDYLEGKRVIELGAGTGVAGLTAASLGANVLLTDLPQLLPGLHYNVQANKLTSRVDVSELVWGQDVAHLQPPFDVIIASDLLYDVACIPLLFITVAQLSGPDTVTLLAFEDRPVVVDVAFRELQKAGLTAKQVPETELDPHWQSPDIHIYKLRLTLQPNSTATAANPQLT
ncbi:hypothetical protein WJX72_007470 [[Myrmecia] bisecta]|uniref:Uncharacterized protein n=1 Tax=[Myrmecia] bisecta TaxID=41462 RepID=A0AAW1QAU6_9CHLO